MLDQRPEVPFPFLYELPLPVGHAANRFSLQNDRELRHPLAQRVVSFLELAFHGRDNRQVSPRFLSRA